MKYVMYSDIQEGTLPNILMNTRDGVRFRAFTQIITILYRFTVENLETGL